MLRKIRVLPVVILAAMMLLGIKVVELRRGISDFVFATAWAQSDKSQGNTAKAEQAKSPAPMDASDEKAGKIAVSKSAGDAAKTTARPAKVNLKTKFSPSEIAVLQKLSGRRETLEQRSRQMAMREKILQATEKRIDNKIGELKKLEGQIKGLLLAHDKETETQIKSLVKVYENMKPKDAARIFEELEMDVLLNVAERMKEVKMAKILAAMAPKKAKTLTVRLATRRPLPKTGG